MNNENCMLIAESSKVEISWPMFDLHTTIRGTAANKAAENLVYFYGIILVIFAMFICYVIQNGRLYLANRTFSFGQRMFGNVLNQADDD